MFNFTIPPINLYTIGKRKYMDKSVKVLSDVTEKNYTNYTSPCTICGKEKSYNLKANWKRLKDRPCRSCASSLQLGGKHWEGNCIDCGNKRDCKYSSSLCLVCHRKRSNTYHMQNYRFRKYGVTREWYEEAVKSGCGICGKLLSSTSKIKRERGHIDHNHTTGKVRGILCDLCNKGLGQFQDSIKNLESAIKYLKEHNSNG